MSTKVNSKELIKAFKNADYEASVGKPRKT